MTIYVLDKETRKLIPKAEYLAKRGPLTVRSAFPTPTIRSDDLGLHGVHCPSDGKTYDSKSAYYGAVKANGGEILGGDDKAAFANPATKEYQPEGVVDDIKRAIETA